MKKTTSVTSVLAHIGDTSRRFVDTTTFQLIFITAQSEKCTLALEKRNYNKFAGNDLSFTKEKTVPEQKKNTLKI